MKSVSLNSPARRNEGSSHLIYIVFAFRDFRYLVPCGALFCLEPLLVKVIRLSLPKLAGDLWGFYFVGWLRVENFPRFTSWILLPSLFNLIRFTFYHPI